MIKSGYNPVTESKNLGRLYHFTPIASAVKIIRSNKLKQNAADDLGSGISFTRNKLLDRGRSTTIRLVLDGNKLSNKYKIKPINHFSQAELEGFNDTSERESEERLLGKDIDNLRSYLISVDIHTRAINDPKVASRLNKQLSRVGLSSIDEFIDLLDKHDIPHSTYGKMSDIG